MEGCPPIGPCMLCLFCWHCSCNFWKMNTCLHVHMFTQDNRIWSPSNALLPTETNLNQSTILKRWSSSSNLRLWQIFIPLISPTSPGSRGNPHSISKTPTTHLSNQSSTSLKSISCTKYALLFIAHFQQGQQSSSTQPIRNVQPRTKLQTIAWQIRTLTKETNPCNCTMWLAPSRKLH
jgi:hypothetical protein